MYIIYLLLISVPTILCCQDWNFGPAYGTPLNVVGNGASSCSLQQAVNDTNIILSASYDCSSNNLQVNGTLFNLSSVYTFYHIHGPVQGNLYTNTGPILINFTDVPMLLDFGTLTTAPTLLFHVVVALTPDQLQFICHNSTYFQVHTRDYSTGELRINLDKIVCCSTSTPISLFMILLLLVHVIS